ncbi:MAG: HAMP domain-containing sensor histidine kinase, partial [Patescibacteria group bacterium]
RMIALSRSIASGDFSTRVTQFGSDELGQLGKQLNAMADIIQQDIRRIKELDRLKSEFVSIASHQLGTPLTVMRWNLEMLAQKKIGSHDKVVRESLETLIETTARMDKLIADLLSVSRIEQNKITYNPEDVSICTLTEKVVAEQKGRAEKKGILVRFECEDTIPSLRLDQARTREILTNLLSNAIKFTRIDGTALIRITRTEDTVVIEVRDNGIGIPHKDQEQMFSKFFRGSNVVKSGEYGGTGLGLYIVKRYVEGQGGTISFTSEENKGTTFTIRFPVGGG